ncbi:nicotinate phosphoribosyltransferase [candidate division KSB1 bacterium]|nr:nicotinate phosphoribosyltransferase [candidate division KSB1 bacterium]
MKKFDFATAEGILFTDQYQLTMAQVYYKMGFYEKEVQFEHFFRSYPDYGTHKAGYCINAGLQWFMNWMRDVRFQKQDIEYLRNQKESTGKRVFEDDFLDWLKSNGSFENLTVQAIPEGRVVHPNVPLTVVQGPMINAQILETALLNQLNFQILIATKASRIKEQGKGQLLLEFGARRGHDRGANAGVRAALIGGADFSSNVGISHALGYPPKGTHAHSMVQLFLALGMSELDSFKAYADIYPDNCILLVDTIDTLNSGIPNAIKVFEELKKKGHKPLGIRLDSGDLAHLTIEAANMLNNAGFPDVKIVLSNELDELNIWQIITQIKDESQQRGIDPDSLVKRLVYGVGTRLITSAGCSALGGVYKLVAVHDSGEWLPAIKVSENVSKTPNPGNKKVWRIYDNRNKSTADLISLKDEKVDEQDKIDLHHPTDHSKSRSFARQDINTIESLLTDIYKKGKFVYDFPSIDGIRKQRESDLERLDSGVKRLLAPHYYHVSLTPSLWQEKQRLIKSLYKS